MMRFRSVAVVVLSLVGSAWLVLSAAAWQPREGAVFNQPTGSYAAKFRIIRHVERAINNTRTGQTILISTYLMDRRQSATALIHARNRGVHVQVVIDGDDARTHASARLARSLNRDNRPRRLGIPRRWGRDNSFVVFCRGSCRGSGSRTDNHAKFFAFSRVRRATHVVMVSSSNLNHGGAKAGWNDLYTVVGNAAVFGHFALIHREMARDRPASPLYRQYRDGRYVSRFFPMRRAGTDADPTFQDLRKVRCRGARGGSGHSGRTAINVSMFNFSGRRGMYLAKRLISMDRDGCDVSIIYGAPSHEVADVLKRSAQHGGVKLWDSRFDRNFDGYAELRVHTKYWLLSGVSGQDTSTWAVHTGSQNWGRASMNTGDEVTLDIASRAAYRQYLANWNYVRYHSARRIGR